MTNAEVIDIGEVIAKIEGISVEGWKCPTCHEISTFRIRMDERNPRRACQYCKRMMED